MTELQRLLQSVMDAADSSMGKIPVAQGSPVLVGAASQIQNAQDLAPEIELDAQTGRFVEAACRMFTGAPAPSPHKE